MKTKTTRIKTARELSQSELLAAIMESMPPLFEHFEEKLREKDGQVLEISLSGKEGQIRLRWGVREYNKEEDQP